jgi:predicted alpha/beta-hydrolase family hydrolase
VLDEAFVAAANALRVRTPLVVGGRSAGARSAARTARELGASGFLALSFPLHPPGRPEKSRRDELAGAAMPVLVLQGTRDAFGRPEEFDPVPDHVTLHPLPGADHALRSFDPAPVVAWIQAALT